MVWVRTTTGESDTTSRRGKDSDVLDDAGQCGRVEIMSRVYIFCDAAEAISLHQALELLGFDHMRLDSWDLVQAQVRRLEGGDVFLLSCVALAAEGIEALMEAGRLARSEATRATGLLLKYESTQERAGIEALTGVSTFLDPSLSAAELVHQLSSLVMESPAHAARADGAIPVAAPQSEGEGRPTRPFEATGDSVLSAQPMREETTAVVETVGGADERPTTRFVKPSPTPVVRRRSPDAVAAGPAIEHRGAETFERGRRLLAANKIAEASRAFDKARDLSPRRAEYHAHSAWVRYLLDGDAHALRHSLSALVELDDCELWIKLVSGRLAKAEGDDEAAFAHFSAVLAATPSNLEAQRECRLYRMRTARPGQKRRVFGRFFNK